MKTPLRRLLEITLLVVLYCGTSFLCFEAGVRQNDQAATPAITSPDVPQVAETPAEAPATKPADKPIAAESEPVKAEYPILISGQLVKVSQARFNGPAIPNLPAENPVAPPIVRPVVAPVVQPACQYQCYCKHCRRCR